MIPCTDVHIHLLYGMDDGPKTREDMEKMLEAAARDQVARIVATPHVTPGVYPFHEELYARRLEEAREIGQRMVPPIEVYGGAEILYSTQACTMLQDGRAPTMAGTNIVLVEFSPDVRYRELRRAVDELVCGGFLPMLAHVERYRCLTQWPPRAKRLKRQQSVLFQVNAATFLVKMGPRKRWFLRMLANDRLMDAIGTDAHNCDTRPTCMEKAYPAVRELCGKRYARVLMDGSILFGIGMRGAEQAE